MKSHNWSLSKTIKNSKIDIARNLKYYLIAPIVLLVIGAVLFFTIGFNKGIDFTGGTILNVILKDEIETTEGYDDAKAKIDTVLSDNGLRASMYQKSETDMGLAICVRYQDIDGKDEAEMNDLTEEVKADLYTAFGLDADDPEEVGLVQDGQRIGATASSELLTNAFIALLVAMAAMLIYISIRFEITSGLAAILSLFHDVLMMAILTIIFRIEINSSFIAAIITIVGYSINNTIIIFDKVKDVHKSGVIKTNDNFEIANYAVKNTMTRSIYTTLTTLLTICALSIIGVSSIRQFALPIVFGLFAGAYSSIFLAPGLWAIAFRPKKVVKTKLSEAEKADLALLEKTKMENEQEA